VRQFKFRALMTLDSWAKDRRRGLDPSATHFLMVHVLHAGQPSSEKYFPAAITRDDGQPLQPGQSQVVTIAVTDDEAPLFLAPGQPFTIWGGGYGRGIVSRRVFTTSGPS
jgi:hypothetical protein